MSVTNSSRSSSFSSVDTHATSMLSEDLEAITEKIASVSPPRRPMVLNWKPLMFSTAFTSSTSSRLQFTSFPPHDLEKPLFGQLSIQSAETLLHQYESPTRASFLAQSDSRVQNVDHIPFPSSLPRELIHCLSGSEWEYFSITNNSVPISIGSMSTSFDHHVAVRRINGGLERYIFGPRGLCVHTVCRIEDVGAAYEEKVPRETLFLREDAEIICNKVLKWWTASLVETQIKSSHEQFRRHWEEAVQYEWDMIKMSKKVDLLV